LLHRWLLVLAIVGAFLLAAGLLSLRKPVYAASAAIYLDVSRTAPGFDEGVAAGELLQHDFIVASQSRPVLEAACASAAVACTPEEVAAPESTLAKRISASSYRGTSTLLVTARAQTPDQAAALANAVAQAIIDQDKAEVVRLFKQPRDNLQKQLTDLQAAMAEEQQQLQHSPAGSPAAAAHQAQLTRLQGQYSVVFGRLQDLADYGTWRRGCSPGSAWVSWLPSSWNGSTTGSSTSRRWPGRPRAPSHSSTRVPAAPAGPSTMVRTRWRWRACWPGPQKPARYW
jgi:uncharacterized protein involved in exopolysaccharide biosynthesis